MSGAPERGPGLYARDAAAPLAGALHALYSGPQGGFRVSDVTFVYDGNGVHVCVDQGLDQELREEIYGQFIDAFQAAGWGFSSSLDPERGMRRKEMLFRHPSTLSAF